MIPPAKSDHEMAEVALSTAQMKDVLEVSRLMAVTPNLESLLEKVAQATCTLLKSQGSSIWLHDPITDELYTTVVIVSGSLRVPANTGIVGAAFTTNRTVAVVDAYADPRFNPSSDHASGYVTRSLMATPLVNIDGKPIGVIEAVNKIGDIFTEQDEQLVQLFADQVGVAIQRHHLQQAAHHAVELQKEISLARKVQLGLLPKKLPSLAGFDLFGWAKSASTTGGDCYDLWRLDDGRLGIFLADASGHGLGPALVVSQIRTLVRALCDGSSKLCSPHDTLLRVNRRLTQDLKPYQFVTVFLGFLESDGKLDWQSAGHGPILFSSSANEPIQALAAAIPPINSSPSLPDDRPEPLQLDPGGLLAIMSDGIFESFSPGNQLFSIKRVMLSLESTRTQPASTAVENLLRDVVGWQAQEQPRDDQTIILLHRNISVPPTS